MSKQDSIVICVGSLAFVIRNVIDAFYNISAEQKEFLIKCTADNIATLMLLNEIMPNIVHTHFQTNLLIEERKNGLSALDVVDIDVEINEAIDRFKKLSLEDKVKNAMVFLM